jgi:hypothetical protein
MEVPTKADKSKGQKYDLPGLQDPATLPKDKALELANKSVTITRKDIKPDKIRRII